MRNRCLFLVVFAALATATVLAQSGTCGATLNLTGTNTSTNASSGNFVASGPPTGPNCAGTIVNSSTTLTLSMSPAQFAASGPFTLFYAVNTPPPLLDLTTILGIPGDCSGNHARFGVGALNVILDGLGFAGPANPFATIAPGANFSMTFNVGPLVPVGTFVNFQAAAINPTLVVTNAATFSVVASSGAVSTTQVHGDDTSTFYPFTCGNTVNFYGVNYSGIYVNSNGNLTFAFGDSTYNETSAQFLSGFPRIAQYWDDRYFPTVLITDAPGHLQFKYTNTQWFCNSSPGSVEQIDIYFGPGGTSPAIQISYLGNQGPFCSTGPIVGISPGNSVSAAAPVDLTASTGMTGAPNAAIYENFNTTGNAFDLLATTTVTFFANDAAGTTWTMTVP